MAHARRAGSIGMSSRSTRCRSARFWRPASRATSSRRRSTGRSSPPARSRLATAARPPRSRSRPDRAFGEGCPHQFALPGRSLRAQAYRPSHLIAPALEGAAGRRERVGCGFASLEETAEWEYFSTPHLRRSVAGELGLPETAHCCDAPYVLAELDVDEPGVGDPGADNSAGHRG